MIDYQIRSALESESAQIKALINLVGINPSGIDWKRFVVALNESGVIISCGQLKPHGENVIELASIATLAEYERQGLASAIITELLKTPTRPLYLMCMAHNRPLYEKFNFHGIEIDEMPKYFRRIKKLFNIADVFRKTGEELLVMKLE